MSRIQFIQNPKYTYKDEKEDEWGISLDSEGSRIYSRGFAPEMSRDVYERITRNLIEREKGINDHSPYHRISSHELRGFHIRVGFNKVSPSVMVKILPAWLKWWERAVTSPLYAKSGKNIISPEEGFALFLKGSHPGEPKLKAMGVSLKRTPSKKRLESMSRAVLRTSIPGDPRKDFDDPGLVFNLTAGVYAILGRLSPEGQRVLLSTLPRHQLVKPSDIPWDLVNSRMKALQSEKGREAWQVKRFQVEADHRGMNPTRVRAVRRGLKTPAQAIPELPAKLAQEYWTSNSTFSPLEWLGEKIQQEILSTKSLTPSETEEVIYTVPLRSIKSAKVLLWFMECLKDRPRAEAFMRQRKAHLPAGEVVTFTLISKLDEVHDTDIHRMSDGPVKVMERASNRVKEEYEKIGEGDYRPLTKEIKNLPTGITQLRTSAALVQAGRSQNHCVGIYAPAVQAGGCHILRIETEEGESIAEVSPDLKDVFQHRGPGNSQPSEKNEKILLDWLAKRQVRKNPSRHRY
jgi:hypothetical protein